MAGRGCSPLVSIVWESRVEGEGEWMGLTEFMGRVVILGGLVLFLVLVVLLFLVVVLFYSLCLSYFLSYSLWWSPTPYSLWWSCPIPCAGLPCGGLVIFLVLSYSLSCSIPCGLVIFLVVSSPPYSACYRRGCEMDAFGIM